MPISHYIAKHLTRPWEFEHPKRGKSQLWFYDFDTDTFGVQTSRLLHTLDDALPQTHETWFNRYLETPLSGYIHAKFGGARVKSLVPNQVQLRALKLAVILQDLRTAVALEIPGVQQNQDALVQLGDDAINLYVNLLDERYEFASLQLRQQRIFFPSTGVVSVPLVGALPVLALPVHPSCLFIAVPRGGHIPQLEMIRAEKPDLLTALSMGLENCRRVVVPGYLWGHAAENKVRETILRARRFALVASRAFQDVNQLWGLRVPERRWVL